MMDVAPPEEQQGNVMDRSPRDADPSPSLSVVAGAVGQTNKAKTLLDAVKPKHKRNKKKFSISDGS